MGEILPPLFLLSLSLPSVLSLSLSPLFLPLSPLSLSPVSPLSLSPLPSPPPSLPAGNIRPEDLMDNETEVIHTQPTADYQAIDSDKEPIVLS